MKNIVRTGAVTAAVGMGVSLALLPTGPASAAGGTQVPCNDITALRNAISQANTSGGSITLAPRCTYTLTSPDNPDDGLPEITGNVTISGRGATIRRAPDSTENFRIFHVQFGGTLTLKSLTVSGGRIADNNAGGGIWNSGTLNLNSATIKRNLAGTGGGIHSPGGQLNLDRSTIERNTATHNGGGITNGSNPIFGRIGSLTMKGGALRDNRALSDSGGGLENLRSTTSLDSVLISGNTALHGGGIHQFGGTLHLTSTTVSHNIAVTGAGLMSEFSTPTLVRSLVTRNTAITAGGGIFNGASSGVTLTDSKVIRNAPDNCSPEGSVPGCGNTPPNSPVKQRKARK
ncbi:right-handed parallel beta-helix repeat-containing protein [Streptomyces sp. NPDC001700]